MAQPVAVKRSWAPGSLGKEDAGTSSPATKAATSRTSASPISTGASGPRAKAARSVPGRGRTRSIPGPSCAAGGACGFAGLRAFVRLARPPLFRSDVRGVRGRKAQDAGDGGCSPPSNTSGLSSPPQAARVEASPRLKTSPSHGLTLKMAGREARFYVRISTGPRLLVQQTHNADGAIRPVPESISRRTLRWQRQTFRRLNTSAHALALEQGVEGLGEHEAVILVLLGGVEAQASGEVLREVDGHPAPVVVGALAVHE